MNKDKEAIRWFYVFVLLENRPSDIVLLCFFSYLNNFLHWLQLGLWRSSPLVSANSPGSAPQRAKASGQQGQVKQISIPVTNLFQGLCTMQSCGVKERPHQLPAAAGETGTLLPLSPAAPVLPLLCPGRSLTAFGVLRRDAKWAENCSFYFTRLFFGQVSETM